MNKIWKTVLVALALVVLTGGGYALNRAGYAHGYTKGLAENVGAENLSEFFEQRFSERFGDDGWGYAPGSRFAPGGMTLFSHADFAGRGFYPGGVSFLRCLFPLFFLGGIIALVTWLVRRSRGQTAGGRGWQLSFGPLYPDADDTPSEK